MVNVSLMHGHSEPNENAVDSSGDQGVDDINELMLSRFPGVEKIYFSYDETKDPSLQGLYIDFLNSLNPAGLPPHRLVLKKGCPVLLLRNINASKGLCNGTRLICKDFAAHVIIAEIAIGERKGSTVFIPRIPLEPTDSHLYPVEFTRRQFPVRPCFAMTINKVAMVRNILPLAEVNLTSKNYEIHVLVIEKDMPKPTSKKGIPCQRLMFQDAQGTKIQAAIFGSDIGILQDTLKMYHTYSITNAFVSETPEGLQFLDNSYELTIKSRTPVEEIDIAGLSMESITHNLTPINNLHNFKDGQQPIDMVFAVVQVGPERTVRNTLVADVQIIDQSLQPMILSLWGRFAEYELQAMTQPEGCFPVVLGLRLKTSAFYGLSLTTRPISAFLFNPIIPQAIALQTWCDRNVDKLRSLPPIGTLQQKKLLLKEPPAELVMKIADLPTTVSEAEVFNVQGIIEVTDFTQAFCYTSCSICKKAMNAYGIEEVCCNTCKQRVNPSQRLKFDAHITDSTGSMNITIFADAAEALYQISDADIGFNESTITMSGIDKMRLPKRCTVAIRARMVPYKDVTEVKFTLHKVLASATDDGQNLLQLEAKSDTYEESDVIPTTAAAPSTPAKAAPQKRKRGPVT